MSDFFTPDIVVWGEICKVSLRFWYGGNVRHA